ncbi:MAG TPA: efflux RND transporter periplasmic adaptor subunit [Chitinophagales bacterium]|nr:efflux RND transporter periplasmic adaptor subunit [Chitinophagales bacterium]
MKKSTLIVIVVLVVLMGGVAYKLVKNKQQIDSKNKVVDRSAIAVPVAVVKAFTGSAGDKFILPAVTQAESEADVVVNAQGKLTNLNIRLGSVVNKGQLLGTVDSKMKELNLRATSLTEEKLKKDYDRYNELYQGKAATEVNVNDVKYNYENTKIQLEQIKQQIADANIIAPISGTIVRKNLEEGEFVNPGTPIATIVDVSKLKAQVMVSENDVYKLKNGATVNVTSDIYPTKVFKGTIRYISPQGDDSHNYPVEITLNNENGSPIKAGTFIRVSFGISGNANTLQIPKIALVEGLKNPYVYVLKDNKASIKKLVLGREIGENVEVLDGLAEGEEVISSGQINLVEGSLVTVIK